VCRVDRPSAPICGTSAHLLALDAARSRAPDRLRDLDRRRADAAGRAQTSTVSPAAQRGAVDSAWCGAVGAEEAAASSKRSRRQRHRRARVDAGVRREAADAAEGATASPGLRCVTPSPTASTTPAYSEPGTNGSGGFIWYLFCTISRSGKFRLAARIATRTSPACGSGVGSFLPGQGIGPIGLSQIQACMAVSSKRRMIGSATTTRHAGDGAATCSRGDSYNRRMRILIANDDGYLAPDWPRW
jgi:hypothetical protein